MHPSLFSSPVIYKQFQQLSDQEQAWLTDKNSLTKKLREFAGEKIQLVLLCEGWISAQSWHPNTPILTYRNLLEIKDPTEATWIRQVEWQYEKNIWLSCTVVIPRSSVILGRTDELICLGGRSIGDVLFKDSTLESSDFQFLSLYRDSITRYRILTYKGQPLLIVETFLPAFFKGLRTLTAAPAVHQPLTSKL